MDWLDTYSDPSVKAASVVTNLWIAAFAITSALFALLGGVVALQWPNPRILCYKTSYSDTPSNSTRSCCSLYSLNLGFTVFWLLVFAIMVIARDVVRIIICLSFWVVHVAVVLLFRMKFKRFGRPERPFNSSLEMGNNGSAAAAASLGPGQAVGIPVYNIPMQTVVIGPRTDGGGGPAAAGAPSSQPPPYLQWYDADCLPPAAGTHPHSGAPAPVPPPAGAAGGGYFGGPGPYPMAAAAYPPQPASSPAGAGPDVSAFVLGQPVTGLPAVLAPTTQAAGAGAAAGATGGRASLEASGHVGATAGAAAAAGAGAVGATGQQQPQQ